MSNPDARPAPTDRIDTTAGPVGLHVEVPAGDGPWPAVVVIHDAAGLTADTVAQCRWLADCGFIAVAPDLFAGGTFVGCLRAVIRDYATWQGSVFDQVEAVRSWAADRDDCTGRVGVLGFCMGGGFALSLAPGHGFVAASANYGMIPKDAEQYFVGACPIIASYGGRDLSLRGAGPKLGRRAHGCGRRARGGHLPAGRSRLPQRPRARRGAVPVPADGAGHQDQLPPTQR